MFEIWHKLHSPYHTHSHYIAHTSHMQYAQGKLHTCMRHTHMHTVATALQEEHPPCPIVICLKE